MARKIKYIFYHATAGPQSQKTEDIFNFWKKTNGWSVAGYHFDTNPDGTIEQYVEIDDVANGVANYNSQSIHFCYKGGIDVKGNPIDNRTPQQIASQIAFMNRMKELFPNAIHLGHRDISRDANGNGVLESWEWIKSCPCYDFRSWAASIGKDQMITPEKIVYKLNNPLIKNETVKAIQMAINMSPDGYYGINTAAEIKTFQQHHRLTDDGIVGEGTAKELIKHLSPDKHKEQIKLLAAIKNN